MKKNDSNITPAQSTFTHPVFRVTSFSKVLAAVIFITLPFLGFWLGTKYAINHSEIPVPNLVNNYLPRLASVSGTPELVVNENLAAEFIHPRCFNQTGVLRFDDEKESTDLFSCAKASISEPYTTSSGGWISANNEDGNGFTGYKIIASGTDFLYVSVVENTGGTGMFSSIQQIQVATTSLLVTNIIAGVGDRCNGGISKEVFDGKELYFSLNITPADFLSLTASSSKDNSYENGLESSASSCFGTANYVYDQAMNESTLKSVSLSSDAIREENSEWTNTFPDQFCFNEHFTKYIDNNKTELTLSELEVFNKEFLKLCK